MDFLATVADLADLLPPQGKRQYLLLRDTNADSAAIGFGLAERLIEQNQRRQAASLRLAEIRGKRNVADDHPEMIAQTKALADCDAEIARINERVAAHNVTAGPRATLLRNIDAWLRATAQNHDFADIEPEPVKLLKGEQIPAGIERHRRRLRELDSDRARVEASPFPSAHAKQVAAAFLDQLAEAATPIVTHAVELGGPLIVENQLIEPAVIFPATKQVELDVATVAGEGRARGYQVDPVALLAVFFRKEMLARLNELIDAESADKDALSPTQRAEQMATIARDRRATEFDEGQLLRAAFGAIEARADMDPACYLLVKPVERAARSGRELSEGVVRGRRARTAEGQPFTPHDIHIPGLTDRAPTG